MYDTLRELHCKFWKELPVPEVERQYDEAFRELMRRLEKLERKLVLRLLDTRGLLAENAAFDSFDCGFRLALELTTESQQYQEERSEEALAVLCTAGMGKSMEKSCRSACRYGERFCISVVVKLPKMV